MRSLALLLACTIGSAAAPPRAVVIDTDAGSDDLMAIAFLLERRDVKIEAITVVHGLAHVAPGVENVRKLAAAAGKRDIPVYSGAEQPLQKTAEFPPEWRKTSDALLAKLPPSPARREAEHAVEYLKRRSYTGVTLLALGPLTNLALAQAQGARFGAIVWMGGALRVPGNLGDGGYFKTTNKTAEWNSFSDPRAAQQVFEGGARIRMVGLDATNQVPLGLDFLNRFSAGARSAVAQAVAGFLNSERDMLAQGIFYAWDPLAAVSVVEPRVVRTERLRLRVTNDGTTVEDPAGAAVDVALGADAARFRKLFEAAVR